MTVDLIVLNLVLAASVVSAWRIFLRLARRGRAVTTRELIVYLTADTQRAIEAIRRAQLSAEETARRVSRFNRAWRNS